MANEILGQKLKLLRQSANLTQQDVADKLQLKSKSTISMWEIGKNEPDILTFLSLCCQYGLTEAYELVKALDLEDTAAFDFAVIASENKLNDNTGKCAVPCDKEPEKSKPYAFCPYCGEKLL